MKTNGHYNTAVGNQALGQINNGSFNVAVGHFAGQLCTSQHDNCTFAGTYADSQTNTARSNSTALGYDTKVTADDQVRIGNSAVTSIGGYANWSNISDGRFKNNIQEDIPGLSFVMNLRPVSYELDRSKISTHLGECANSEFKMNSSRMSGFIAQEVEATATKIGYQFSGIDVPKGTNDMYALRYAEFTVPLVKAVQEQQQQIAAQQQMIELLIARIDQLENQLSR
jgi:hypothetical protein